MNPDNLNLLLGLASKAADVIRSEKGYIRVVTHFDADGICAGAIMYETLNTLKKNFQIDFVKQLERDIAEDLSKKDADLWIFTDLGSGQLATIKEFFSGKKVVVADHHQPADAELESLTHVNPHLVGIDGKDEISGAGVAYLICRMLTSKAWKLVDLAVIGAAGDVQKVNGNFKGINSMFLNDAELAGKIKVDKGLRLFGRYTRPLIKAVEYSTDPFIPNISGNQSGALQFLNNYGVPIKDKKGSWLRLCDLSKDDEKKLASALLIEAANAGVKPGDLIGNVYKLSSNYEIREFTTILNACGRIEKPVDGMKLCLGHIDSADAIMGAYRKKIAIYLDWIKVNKDSFIKTDNAVYVIAGSNISDNMIGTSVSIAMRSILKANVAVGFANSDNGVKVSGRILINSNGANLGKAVQQASKEVGGEGGGHTNAAGAKIPLGSEKKFIELIDPLLPKKWENGKDIVDLNEVNVEL
ncbi:DHHA1 domain protein [uncultured archaeon]|nr:DHHA1 domain protein [uncultured archaeon]